MIVYGCRWLKLFGVIGMTIAPFIFICSGKKECPETLIKHERVHVRQQIKLLWIGFFIAYAWYYLKNRFSGMNHDTAYRKIPFEIEAYGAE